MRKASTDVSMACLLSDDSCQSFSDDVDGSLHCLRRCRIVRKHHRRVADALEILVDTLASRGGSVTSSDFGPVVHPSTFQNISRRFS